jgi:5-carboxymethyl-2-hydroxymuconate isomerase
MIEGKEFNLGTLRFRMFVVKPNEEAPNNFSNLSIDILDGRTHEVFQNIVNDLDAGIYEIKTALNNENFIKIEEVDGTLLESKDESKGND